MKDRFDIRGPMVGNCAICGALVRCQKTMCRPFKQRSAHEQSTYITASSHTYFGDHTCTDFGAMPSCGHDTNACTGCANMGVRGDVQTMVSAGAVAHE